MEGGQQPSDTIVAIATAAARAAVGIVRISGPQSAAVARAVLGSVPAPRRARFCRFLRADGSSIDQGLALYFQAPASFTGEDVLELHGHGGTVVLGLLLARLQELGCRPARPGEFSERAFHNGKLDLAQAEAIADLIEAGTEAAARAAVRSLQGEFSQRVHGLQAELTDLRAYAEAAIDFSGEELEFLSDSALAKRLEGLRASTDRVLGGARQGALLGSGLHVVIAGAPNAGKSSLLNRLAGDEIAIVSDLPGTTRDLLKLQIHVDGLAVTFVDTAGLRTALDRIEAEGVRRARAEIAEADHVLYVIDAGDAVDSARCIPSEVQDSLTAVPTTLVVNKIDLSGETPRIDPTHGGSRGTVYVSAQTGAGLELLKTHVTASAGYAGADGGAFAARARHVIALTRVQEHVAAAREALRGGATPELVAEELKLAQQCLSVVTGEFTSDDLLGEIFAGFCIGK